MRQRRQAVRYLAAGVLAALTLGGCAGSRADGEGGVCRPNIRVGDTLYWYTTTYEASAMPGELVSIGTVRENLAGIAEEDFLETGAASGVGVGAELFQGEGYPGQLYVQWEDNLNLFAAQPLNFPLVRCGGELYIQVQPFRDSGFSDDFSDIRPTPYSGDFSHAGTLTRAEIGCAVPQHELEGNYLGGWQEVYRDPADPSTIYVELDGNGTLGAFYNVALIPLDYTAYETEGTDR